MRPKEKNCIRFGCSGHYFRDGRDSWKGNQTMAPGRFDPVLRYIRQIASASPENLSDHTLLTRYVDRQDEAAFSDLVQRYGGLVLGVCHRVVGDWHTAEDCLQAVFLVLATKANSLPEHESLGPWLHAVAVKIALKANAQATIRRIRERAGARRVIENQPDPLEWRELGPVLDEAVSLLPRKYRIPFVLCYLQGKTVGEIAKQLGEPKGTVASRLARARAQLRARLFRRGISLSAVTLASAFDTRSASACVSQELALRAIESARLLAAGKAVTGMLSGRTIHVMEGAVRMMMITNIKLISGMLVAAALGLMLVSYQIWGQSQTTDKLPGAAQSSLLIPTAKPVVKDAPLERQVSNAPQADEGARRTVPLLSLRRAPIEVYRLGPGDTLGIIVDGILGNSEKSIPIIPRESPDTSPGIGYPVLVREDGTISMPQVPPIRVEGMSLEEVERTLRETYTVKRKIVPPEKFSAILTLARRRSAKVLVIRQDASGNSGLSEQGAPKNGQAGARRGTGQQLELPNGENDLLTALARTGGIPGDDAIDDVVIERTRPEALEENKRIDVPASKTGQEQAPLKYVKQTLHIPMRLPPNTPVPYTEDDITLQTGDVVFVALRPAPRK
jgi:RNA polymerase sigma factor (sigma-70 family)